MRRFARAVFVAVFAVVAALPGTAGGQTPALPGAEVWKARHAELWGRTPNQQTLKADPSGERLFTTSSVLVTSEPVDFDFGVVAYDADDGSQLWQSTYGHTFDGVESPVALDVSPDGAYVYVTGYSTGGWRCETGCGYNTDIATVAFDARTGDTVWVTRYDNGQENSLFSVSDTPTDVTVGANGVVYVTGRGGAADLSDAEVATIAYDGATGQELWVVRYSRGHFASGRRVEVSPDGSQVFVGGRDHPPRFTDLLALSLDAATGEILWTDHYAGPGGGWDGVEDMQVSPDGKRLFVTGDTFGGQATSGDYLTLAYDTATGERAWVNPWAPPGHQTEEPSALAVSPDGLSVYVTGTAESSGVSGRDYATVAYDALTGAIRWAKLYSSPGRESDFAHGVVVSPDSSRVYVTGGAVVDVGGVRAASYHTLAYQAHVGQEIWSASHRTEVVGWGAAAYAVEVHPDGSKVYVTGVDHARSTTVAYCATPGLLGTCL